MHAGNVAWGARAWGDSWGGRGATSTWAAPNGRSRPPTRRCTGPPVLVRKEGWMEGRPSPRSRDGPGHEAPNLAGARSTTPACTSHEVRPTAGGLQQENRRANYLHAAPQAAGERIQRMYCAYAPKRGKYAHFQRIRIGRGTYGASLTQARGRAGARTCGPRDMHVSPPLAPASCHRGCARGVCSGLGGGISGSKFMFEPV
jgi:hypothetical protein